METIKIIFILYLSVAVKCPAKAQLSKDIYQSRIETLNKIIWQYFYDSSNALYYETNNKRPGEKKHSYLWPLCALVQAANEEETIQPSKAFMAPVMKAIDQYYSAIPPVPAYQAYVTKEEKDDRFYDDNQWIAIACLDAYNRTGTKNYLDIAKKIYRFMMTGFDTAAGGGLYWKEGDHTTKNTCSNGPGILVALQLYKITKDKNYLDTALVLYKWVNAHLRSPQGVFYDNIKIPSLKIDSALYTYNTGTMLQSNVLLYNILKDEKYLLQAQQIATAAENVFYKNKKLQGSYWFNAVLLRGYQELYKVDRNEKRFQFFIDDANRIWQDEKDDKGLVGKKDKRKSLIDQAAMIEIYARLAEML
ncbi:MAG: glycoside hydrolase family 76 protein [Ginsengibacter sp.]